MFKFALSEVYQLINPGLLPLNSSINRDHRISRLTLDAPRRNPLAHLICSSYF